jgi:excisionase family DNA binding protein
MTLVARFAVKYGRSGPACARRATAGRTPHSIRNELAWQIVASQGENGVVEMAMATKEFPLSTPALDNTPNAGVSRDVPLTVRDAAAFLGVSIQTVYLWVERRQIPHLRVMGRNIRFLRSDLEAFRAGFRCEAESG